MKLGSDTMPTQMKVRQVLHVLMQISISLLFIMGEIEHGEIQNLTRAFLSI